MPSFKIMVKSPVYINQIQSVSALGSHPEEVWKSYKKGLPLFNSKIINSGSVKVSALSQSQEKRLQSLKNTGKPYATMDKTTLMAILTARDMFARENALPHHQNTGVNIGSSRGATSTFEQAYHQFISRGEVPFMTSPMTTLGNVASSVAQDLGLKGPAISHSITCSSALHALLNGYAFLKSGMLQHFIIGGTEAPLTDFTIAQMQALKLYSRRDDDWPCRSLDVNKKDNTLVLGEAACLAWLSIQPLQNSLEIKGLGYATEQIEHSVALSGDAKCLQDAMQMALHNAELNTVDAIVLHAPGTVKGDLSELKAIQKTFDPIPALTTNKFLIGHTFGASGAMSLEMAVMMLRHNQFIPNPFYQNENFPERLNTVMVNAVGFGGNAISLILKS